MVVGSTLIRGQLLAAILQTVHPHALVEPQLVRAVLALHLPVMTRGRDLDPMILYPHFNQRLLEQRPVPGFRHQQCVGELRPVVRLDHPYRKRRAPDQLLQKVLRAHAAVFIVHLPVCPARTFVLRRKLVILPSAGYAVRRHKLHVYLDLLPGIFRPLIRLVLSLPTLFPGRNSCEAVRLKQP